MMVKHICFILIVYNEYDKKRGVFHMRLMVQADDFAMTDAVAEGILKCAREGILTQTG